MRGTDVDFSCTRFPSQSRGDLCIEERLLEFLTQMAMSLISLSGRIWNLHSIPFRHTLYSVLPFQVGDALRSVTWWQRPSNLEVVWQSYTNLHTAIHTEICTNAPNPVRLFTKHSLKRNVIVENVSRQSKRLFQKASSLKTWYEGQDVGSAMSDRRNSHFNRHRDEAWPLLTGVLSHLYQHDVTIVEATSTKKPEEIPHQTGRRALHATANKVVSAFTNQSNSTSINQ